LAAGVGCQAFADELAADIVGGVADALHATPAVDGSAAGGAVAMVAEFDASEAWRVEFLTRQPFAELAALCSAAVRLRLAGSADRRTRTPAAPPTTPSRNAKTNKAAANSSRRLGVHRFDGCGN
jgi:hypothetical protein